MIESQNADMTQNQGAGSIAPPEERLVQMPQHKFDEIVKLAKRDAAEKARQEMQSQGAHSMGGMTQMSHEQIIAAATQAATQQALAKLQEEQRAKDEHAMHDFHRKKGENVAREFLSKIEASKERIPGIDKAVGSLGLGNAPHVVELLNEVDNLPDVLKEMDDNPSKLALIANYYAQFGPDLARRELQKLSSSIKTNQAATQEKSANEPLNQLQQSTVGADNGSKTIKDVKRNPKYRG